MFETSDSPWGKLPNRNFEDFYDKILNGISRADLEEISQGTLSENSEAIKNNQISLKFSRGIPGKINEEINGEISRAIHSKLSEKIMCAISGGKIAKRIPKECSKEILERTFNWIFRKIFRKNSRNFERNP